MSGAESPAWAPGSLAQCLFAPRSVALVGASGDPKRNTARPQQFLRRHGYAGRVLPVNATRSEVLGERAWPRVTDIDETIDHAFIMVGAAQVEMALRDCSQRAVPVATIVSDGFSESGPDGVVAQQRLAALARELGIRILGPNCIGLVNPVDRVALTVNAALNGETPQPGSVAVVSQSGSMLGTLLSRGQARGLRFSRMISVGNEADLAVGEITDLLVDDPATDTILLFLETLRDAPRLAQAARRAHRAGKVVVAYKLGRSDLGAAMAVSHTGALVGSDSAVDAYFRNAGIARVEMLDTLIEIAPLLANGPRTAGAQALRVAVVTTTGGGAAMVVDRMGALGLAPAIPGAEFCDRMVAQGIQIRPSPVIDLTLAATPAKYEAVLRGLLEAEFCDAVLAVVGSSAQFQPSLAVAPIVATAGTAARAPRPGLKPLAVFLAPQADASLALLAEHGIAAFRTPEACADALATYSTWRAPVASADAEPLVLAGLPRVNPSGVVDEQGSLALFDQLGIATVPRQLLDAQPSESAIARGGSMLGWPVAAKLVSADLPHKTEAGAVSLGLADVAQVSQAIADMLARVRAAAPAARVDGVMLQPMVSGLIEVIVGYREDPLVGPVVMLGMGGRLAELWRDLSLRLAPVTAGQAREMVGEVRGLAQIQGFRGLPRGDVDALVAAICALGRLALVAGQPVAEAEINPLLVHAEGVTALDGLVVLKRAATAGFGSH